MLKRIVLFVFLVIAMSNTLRAQSPLQSKPAPEIPQGFIIGADISWVQAAEDRGIKFSDNGVQKDILEILKNHGFNYVRLRVFHDPTKATPRDRPYSMQGYCDLDHTIEMAKRIKAADMGLLINFHYSVTLDLYGSEISSNAATYYTTGLKGRYGEAKLTDDHVPVKVEITGWSPFIPGDADNSSLPVAAMEFKFSNFSFNSSFCFIHNHTLSFFF
jgi:hypothetical protein